MMPRHLQKVSVASPAQPRTMDATPAKAQPLEEGELQTPYAYHTAADDGSPMPELGTPFSTPAAARETPLPSKEPAASVAHKSTPAAARKTPLPSEEASACAQATASALAGLTVGLSPSTPSPPKASPRASPAGVLPPQESNSDPDCCLLDAAAAPPLPPVAYPYLSSLNDVISKSYVVAGAAVGLALGVAYSLGLARQRPPM